MVFNLTIEYTPREKNKGVVATNIVLGKRSMHLYQGFEIDVINICLNYIHKINLMKSMSLYEIHFGFPMRKLLQIFFHPKDITHNGLTPQYTSLETRHELDETSTFIINLFS